MKTQPRSISTEIFNLTYKKNIPLYTVFEITYRCNLNCCHCYITREVKNPSPTGGDECGEKLKTKNELSTENIKDILHQLANAGCLHLVFTGGEPFLRQDLLELCEYARNLQFDLRIFTNGTLIDNLNAKFLSQIGISGIEISVYGKERTHDSIVGLNGVFKKVLAGIEILTSYSVPVTIKSPIMNLNFDDYPWLIDFATTHHLKYKFDPVIAPKNNGDKSILKYQLTDNQLKIVFNDKRLINRRETAYDLRLRNIHEVGRYDFSCSAGRNFAGISPDGTVYPCIQFLYTLGNLQFNKFSQIWHRSEDANYIRNINLENFSDCRS
ncbi:MAG: radical SAM protein, partial [Elusimicrobiota bacterium]|nr:radical SAM protein [Elusimicrobiota bacterium]